MLDERTVLVANRVSSCEGANRIQVHPFARVFYTDTVLQCSLLCSWGPRL